MLPMRGRAEASFEILFAIQSARKENGTVGLQTSTRLPAIKTEDRYFRLNLEIRSQIAVRST